MVNDSTCHGCGAALPPSDGISLRRCAACGALQVRLSEELRAQAAAERERYEEGLAQGLADAERSPAEVRWDRAIALAAAGSAVAVALCALLPSLVVAAWWVPVAVLIVYRLRFPRTVLTPLTGARVGAVVGLFFCGGAAVAGTVYLVVRRFGLHRMGGFDTFYTAALAAAEKQAVAQNGAPAAVSFGALGVPEFRAGMLLLFGLLASVCFVLLCVTSGAISAAAQRRRTSVARNRNNAD